MGLANNWTKEFLQRLRAYNFTENWAILFLSFGSQAAPCMSQGSSSGVTYSSRGFYWSDFRRPECNGASSLLTKFFGLFSLCSMRLFCLDSCFRIAIRGRGLALECDAGVLYPLFSHEFLRWITYLLALVCIFSCQVTLRHLLSWSQCLLFCMNNYWNILLFSCYCHFSHQIFFSRM